MLKCTDAGAVYENERFDGPIVVDAPGVRFINTRHYGTNPDDRLITTGPGTILDHVYIEGSPQGQKVGVLVNAADVQILSATILRIHHSNDAQCILGYDGTKNLIVDGGHLEASGENIMFGGADAASEENIPQDIVVKNVTMLKPLTWQGIPNCTIKNLFEVKCGKRITLQDCVLSYSWVHGQTGYGILLTVRNQDNGAPFSTIADVTIRRNVLRACAGGIQILGKDTSNDSVAATNLVIEDNRIEIDPATYGGNGRVFQVSNGTQGLRIARNVVQSRSLNNSFLYFDGEPTTGFEFVENDVPEGEYGAAGDGTGQGTLALDVYAPGYVWSDVVVHRDPSVGRNINYPPGTQIV